MRELLDFVTTQRIAVDRLGNLQISTLDNPEVLFKKSDKENLSEELVCELQIITTGSFGVEKNLGGMRKHVLGADQLALLHDEDSIIAFGSSRFFSQDELVYIHGIAVRRDLQGGGVGRVLLSTLMALSGMRLVGLTTQNPVVFHLLSRMLADIYPSPGQRIVPGKLRTLGGKIVEGRGGVFNPETFVIEGIYKSCLYPRIPESGDPAVDQWFNQSLKVKEGLTCNGFLFLGSLD